MSQVNVLRHATVIGWTKGHDGKTAGTYDHSPIFNIMLYAADFPDGEVSEYSHIFIAENRLSGVDNEGFTITYLPSIIDHSSDGSTGIESKWDCITERANIRMQKTIRGYKLIVR